MMKKMWKLPAAIAAVLIVSACAGGPDPDSFGGRLQAEGGAVAKLGQNWTEGEDLIEEGRDLMDDGEGNIDEGEDLVSKGKKQVRRGEEMIRKGERLKREAEQAYRLQTGTVPAS